MRTFIFHLAALTAVISGVKITPLRADEIPHAAGLKVSSQGLAKISGQLPKLLRSRGVDFSQGSLGDFTLSNISLFNFQVSVEQARYEAPIQSITVTTGPNGLVFSAQVPSLSLTAPNATLRALGGIIPLIHASDIEAKTDARSALLTVSAPISLSVGANGAVNGRIESLQTNFNELTLDPATYTVDIPLLPDVHASLPKALNDSLQQNAGQWIDQKLPALLSSELSGFLAKLPDYEQGIAGSFQWSVAPESIETTAQEFSVSLAGSLESPERPQALAVDSALEAKSLPDWKSLEGESYDAAIAVNQAILNQAVQIGFDQKLFSTKQALAGFDRTLTLTKSPSVAIGGAVPDGLVRARFAGDLSLRWYETIVAFTDHISLQMDALVRIVPNPDGTLKILLQQIDPSSIQANRFQSTLADDVKKLNTTLASSPIVLKDKIAFPDNLVGIPMKVQKVQTDASGYLLALMAL